MKDFFKTALTGLWKLAIEAMTKPSRAPGNFVQATVELGSGYSVEAERMANLEKLRALCEEVIVDPALMPKDGITYCNIGVKRVARAMGCADFSENDTANMMVDIMEFRPGWRKDNAERAADHAMKGGLAVAGKMYPGHGHVAIIYPEPCQFSGSWGKPTCMLANVGQKNGLIKTSGAFPVASGEPAFYLWGETA